MEGKLVGVVTMSDGIGGQVVEVVSRDDGNGGKGCRNSERE